MVKKIFLDTLPIILIIAMFAYVFTIYLGIFQIPFIYKYTTSLGQTMWRFDIHEYLINIQNNFTSIAELELEKNPLEWQNTQASFIDRQFWQTLLNNLAYMFNYFIYFLNVILFIFRFLAYIIINILSILGMVRKPTMYMDKLYEPNWFMEIFVWISENLQIPFIKIN